jgi:hypothetical protein
LRAVVCAAIVCGRRTVLGSPTGSEMTMTAYGFPVPARARDREGPPAPWRAGVVPEAPLPPDIERYVTPIAALEFMQRWTAARREMERRAGT